MKGINLHQKSKKPEILLAKGWNICFWVKNMEWQVYCAPPPRAPRTNENFFWAPHSGRFWQKLATPCFSPKNIYSNLLSLESQVFFRFLMKIYAFHELLKIIDFFVKYPNKYVLNDIRQFTLNKIFLRFVALTHFESKLVNRSMRCRFLKTARAQSISEFIQWTSIIVININSNGWIW